MQDIYIKVKEDIDELIKEGYLAKSVGTVESVTEFGLPYIDGPLYEKWISKVIIFINKYFNRNPLKISLEETAKEAVGNGENHFNKIVGGLAALKETLHLSLTEEREVMSPTKINKIFISHAYKDKDYVELLIQLMNDIGIAKSNEHIFCSSFEGYGIPIGEKIFEHLKGQFSQDIFVLFILSDNYYNSVPCLNEMGASWVTAKDHQTIMLPNFEFSKIKGAIDPTEISFHINDSQKLNAFKDKIIKVFELNEVNNSIWERDKMKFLAEIEKLYNRDKYANSLSKIEIGRIKQHAKTNELEIEIRFINNGTTPIEFQNIQIVLVDEKGNLEEIVVDYEFIENKHIYPKENRREVYKSFITNKQFNARSNITWSVNSSNITAY